MTSLHQHVCPSWIGWFLVSPLRRLLENPEKLLSEHVRPGMTVLEPGPGMGFFTLPLARLVGESGRVVAVELQEAMRRGLLKRARRASLESRIEVRPATPDSMGLENLAGACDLALAIHLVHEVPNQAGFFQELAGTLKPGGRLLIKEPPGHVNAEEFAKSRGLVRETGLVEQEPPDGWGTMAAAFKKPMG